MPQPEYCFDQQAALARLAGDEDLLREVAGIYLDGYESMLQGVLDAVATGDAEALETAAHLLKGSVASFDARAAGEAALRLEQMGRDGKLDGAAEAAMTLEGAVRRLAEDLADYRERA